MTENERLLKYMEIKKISYAEFERGTGYNRRNLTNLKNRPDQMPKTDLVKAALEFFPKLNIRWWILGEEPMEQQKMKDEERERLEEKIQGLEREVRLAEKAYDAMKELSEELKRQLEMK